MSFDPRLRVTVRIAGVFLLGGPLVGTAAGSVLTPLGMIFGAFAGLFLGVVSGVASAIAVGVTAGPEEAHRDLSEQRMRRALINPPLIVIAAAGALTTVITAFASAAGALVVVVLAAVGLIIGTPMVLLILNASVSYVLRPVLPRGIRRPKATLVVAAWTTPVLLTTVAFTLWRTALS